MSQPDLVWYACYGSNTLENRFLCYIKGGKANGSKKTNLGCKDKSLPVASKPLTINHELYFANESSSWHHSGVCFIDPQPDKKHRTYGRMYLITKQQFTELVKQENQFENNLEINFDSAIQDGSLLLDETSWYGNLLCLGNEDGYPIFTFTGLNRSQKINPPSNEYLSTIIKGLKETYNFNSVELKTYFKNISGIKNTLMEGELDYLVE